MNSSPCGVKSAVRTSAYLIAIAVGQLDSRRVGPRSHVWSEPNMVEAVAYEFAERLQCDPDGCRVIENDGCLVVRVQELFRAKAPSTGKPGLPASVRSALVTRRVKRIYHQITCCREPRRVPR